MKLYLTNTYIVFIENTQEKLLTVSNNSNVQSSLDYIKSSYVKTLDSVFINVLFLYRKVMIFLFNYCCI